MPNEWLDCPLVTKAGSGQFVNEHRRHDAVSATSCWHTARHWRKTNERLLDHDQLAAGAQRSEQTRGHLGGLHEVMIGASNDDRVAAFCWQVCVGGGSFDDADASRPSALNTLPQNQNGRATEFGGNDSYTVTEAIGESDRKHPVSCADVSDSRAVVQCQEVGNFSRFQILGVRAATAERENQQKREQRANLFHGPMIPRTTRTHGASRSGLDGHFREGRRGRRVLSCGWLPSRRHRSSSRCTACRWHSGGCRRSRPRERRCHRRGGECKALRLGFDSQANTLAQPRSGHAPWPRRERAAEIVSSVPEQTTWRPVPAPVPPTSSTHQFHPRCT